MRLRQRINSQNLFAATRLQQPRRSPLRSSVSAPGKPVISASKTCGGGTRGYIAFRRVHECKQCGYQCSVTAGTIFHKTRTPLTSWFWAIYRMSHDKKGISAVQLMKEIGVSYTTAWLMPHKIRKAMEDRDWRYKLHGIIEMAASSPTLGAAIAISTGRASSTPQPRSRVSKNLPTRCFPGSTSRSRT